MATSAAPQGSVKWTNRHSSAPDSDLPYEVGYNTRGNYLKPGICAQDISITTTPQWEMPSILQLGEVKNMAPSIRDPVNIGCTALQCKRFNLASFMYHSWLSSNLN